MQSSALTAHMNVQVFWKSSVPINGENTVFLMRVWTVNFMVLCNVMNCT